MDKPDESFWAHFDGLPVVMLATAEGGQPRVRPLTVVHHERQLFILTGAASAKIDQLKANPAYEFCLIWQDGDNNGYIRGAGDVAIIEDMAVKTTLAETAPYFDMYWKGVDDPDYALMRLDMKEAEYMPPGDMAGTKFIL